MDQTYYIEDTYPLEQDHDNHKLSNKCYDDYDVDHLSIQHEVAGNVSGHLDNFSAVEYYYEGNDCGYEADPEHFNYVEPAILFLIYIVGLIGNGLVILVIVRQVAMRKVTYLYLTNLAVVNVFYLLTSVPVSAISYAISDWPFGAIACKINGYVTSVCLSVNVFTLMVTGLDRYFAVLHPVTSRKWRTERKAMVVILTIWVMSFLIMIPRIFLYDVQVFFSTEPYNMCSRYAAFLTTRRVDSTLMLVTMYIFPQLVLGFCHFKIGLLLWRSRRPGAESQEVSLIALRERRRIAKIVFAVTLAFGIGWLPVHVMNMSEDFSDRGASLLFNNRPILFWGFSFGANAINPILYCLLSKHFRKHFKRAVTCWNSNSQNAVNNVRPISGLQRPHEEIVVIDLENDLEIKSDANNDDDTRMNGDEGTDGSVRVITGMTGGQNENSLSSNRYVHTGNCSFQVSPSYKDSGHESDDEEKRASGKINPVFKKTMVVSTASESRYPMPHVV